MEELNVNGRWIEISSSFRFSNLAITDFEDENFCDNRCLKLIRLGEIGLKILNLAYFVNMADSSRLLLLLLLLFFSSSSASSA